MLVQSAHRRRYEANRHSKSERVRGVFERPAGSGCWWINYYVDGKQYREKVGRRSDALALYQKRKADARRKVKLPELVRGKTVTFGHFRDGSKIRRDASRLPRSLQDQGLYTARAIRRALGLCDYTAGN